MELPNRFQLLEEIPVDELNEHCKKVRDNFTSTSESTQGFKEVSRKPWISDQTWDLIGGVPGVLSDLNKIVKYEISHYNCIKI